MSGWTTNERCEHYAQMLIEVLSEPNTHLSSATAERLLRAMRTGGRGNLRLVNTISAETESASTTQENADLVMMALDLMRACIHSGLDESMEPIRLCTTFPGGTVELSLTITTTTTNDGGQSEYNPLKDRYEESKYPPGAGAQYPDGGWWAEIPSLMNAMYTPPFWSAKNPGKGYRRMKAPEEYRG